jgi:hypothetical protein
MEVEKYAEAFDVLLTPIEKIRLIYEINKTLPKEMQIPDQGVATTAESFLNALDGASRQLMRIALSSGFNPWIGTSQLSRVSTFEEFSKLLNQLHEWKYAYATIIDELNENNGNQH